MVKLAAENGLGVVFSVILLVVLIYVIREQYKLINIAREENTNFLKALNEITNKLNDITGVIKNDQINLHRDILTNTATTQSIKEDTSFIKSFIEKISAKMEHILDRETTKRKI